MKQYVIDEFRFADFEKIKTYMDAKFDCSGIDNLYWIPLNEDVLTDVQTVHTECHPFYFAVDLEPERICCELLVRTRNRVRCDCMDYASVKQRNWFISLIDSIFNELDIII